MRAKGKTSLLRVTLIGALSAFASIQVPAAEPAPGSLPKAATLVSFTYTSVYLYTHVCVCVYIYIYVILINKASVCV